VRVGVVVDEAYWQRANYRTVRFEAAHGFFINSACLPSSAEVEPFFGQAEQEIRVWASTVRRHDWARR
jgi:hypothetical protein